jgi:hypothetical protein
MPNLRPNDDPRNLLAGFLSSVVATTLRHPDVIEAARALFAAPTPPVEPEAGVLVAKSGAARALGVSVSTLDRLVAEGAPHSTIGGRKRFDIGELIAWSNARGQRPANVKSSKDSTDVSDILEAHGLRAIGGGR